MSTFYRALRAATESNAVDLFIHVKANADGTVKGSIFDRTGLDFETGNWGTQEWPYEDESLLEVMSQTQESALWDFGKWTPLRGPTFWDLIVLGHRNRY